MLFVKEIYAQKDYQSVLLQANFVTNDWIISTITPENCLSPSHDVTADNTQSCHHLENKQNHQKKLLAPYCKLEKGSYESHDMGGGVYYIITVKNISKEVIFSYLGYSISISFSHWYLFHVQKLIMKKKIKNWANHFFFILAFCILGRSQFKISNGAGVALQ
jgi:uncharacterized membrane protein